MKINSLRYLYLPILLILFINTTSIAENDLLALGDHLFQLKNYDAAITEYKRFIFFHPDDTHVAATYYQIGLAYRTQGLWQEAIVAMRNAILNATTEDDKSEFQINLAVTLIASKNYDLAQLELIRVMLRDPNVELDRRVMFLRSVAYVYQFRWEEARELLQDYTTDGKLDILFDKAENLPHKSPRVAKVLSTILPGAGQIYTGNWRSGLNALLLNGVFGYVAVDAVLDKHYADATLWTFLIFLRYYQGNFFRAETAVKTYNNEISQRAANDILDRLQEIAVDTTRK